MNNPIEDKIFKVGRDISKGEYYVKALNYFYLSVLDEPDGRYLFNSSESTYIKVENGEYLKIFNGILTKVEDLPQRDFLGYVMRDGMYKVGVDLPEGEYHIKSYKKGNTTYIYKDTRGSGEEVEILENGVYVNLKKGEYIQIKNAILHSFENTLKDNTKNGYYFNGMFKVGVDLKASKYLLKAIHPEAYYKIIQEGEEIIEEIFSDEIEINLSKNDYIVLKNAKMKVDNFNFKKPVKLDKYRREISDLKKDYQRKDKNTRQIIEKRFNKNEMTYNKFISQMDKSEKIFNSYVDNIFKTQKDEEDIKDNISVLKTFIEKLDLLNSEIILNMTKSNRNDYLFEELDNLIDSVKYYDV